MRSWEVYVYMAKILIKNGRVWDGEHFLYADLFTDGDKISKIEPHISENADFIYDADGKTVSAGLVDAHVHLRVHHTDQFGIQAEMSSFPFGVTAVADAGRSRGERAILDSFAVKNVVFANVHIRNNVPDLEELAQTVVRFGDKTVGVKVYFDTEVSEVTDLSPLTAVCGFAREQGLRVMVHCSNALTPMADILHALSAGDILTHAFHGGKSSAAEDCFESMKQAQSRGVIIDSGFAGHVHTDFGVLKKAIHCGIVPDTLSTDITRFSAYKRGGRYGMTMCMNIAQTMGMREEDIFRAVTSNSSKALGMESEWGYLKIGRCADIAVLDYTNEGFDLTDRAGNHISNTQGWRCVLTVSNGEVLYKD